MSEINWAEKRTSQRVEVRVPVRWYVDDGVEHKGTMQNVSRGGMLLVAERALPAGDRVRVTFSGKDGAEHTVVGDVVRSTPLGTTGVSFVGIDDATLSFVREVLGVP